MSKPLKLSIGDEREWQEPERKSEGAVTLEPVTQGPAVPEASTIEMYETLKRHEEMLRDLVIEVRLLYHNLPDKEKKRLEERREHTTREVRDSFAGHIRALEEKIARLRGSR